MICFAFVTQEMHGLVNTHWDLWFDFHCRFPSLTFLPWQWRVEPGSTLSPTPPPSPETRSSWLGGKMKLEPPLTEPLSGEGPSQPPLPCGRPRSTAVSCGGWAMSLTVCSTKGWAGRASASTSFKDLQNCKKTFLTCIKKRKREDSKSVLQLVIDNMCLFHAGNEEDKECGVGQTDASLS